MKIIIINYTYKLTSLGVMVDLNCCVGYNSLSAHNMLEDIQDIVPTLSPPSMFACFWSLFKSSRYSLVCGKILQLPSSYVLSQNITYINNCITGGI